MSVAAESCGHDPFFTMSSGAGDPFTRTNRYCVARRRLLQVQLSQTFCSNVKFLPVSQKCAQVKLFH